MSKRRNHMPVGMLTDVCSLFMGGHFGSILGKRISENLKTALNNIFGFCAMTIGIRLIVKMDSLSVVVLSVVLGVIIGEKLHLEERINSCVRSLAPKLLKGKNAVDYDYISLFCSVAVLLCCSGTGWYGVLNEGFTGDYTILVTKAILDFFTALIFAALLGRLVSFLAIPQLAIYIVLFSISHLVSPYITDRMIADFSAVGGIIELATGMRIAGVKRDPKVMNIVPAMIIVLPISALWAFLFG